MNIVTKILYLSIILGFSVLIVVSVKAEEVGPVSLGQYTLTTINTDSKNSSIGALTAKYGFFKKEPFKPYIGAGVAYNVEEDKGSNPGTKIKTGLIYQLGFNYSLNEKATINLNYNQFSISPDIENRVNDSSPSQVGIGLKIKF